MTHGRRLQFAGSDGPLREAQKVRAAALAALHGARSPIGVRWKPAPCCELCGSNAYALWCEPDLSTTTLCGACSYAREWFCARLYLRALGSE